MSDVGKILAVHGSPSAGKATTIGNLIFKCGGIDMPTLERLEKGCNNGYAKAFNDVKARNETLYFHTPRNKVIITENISTSDGLLLIVTPHKIDKQLQEIGNEWDGMATHLAGSKAVILVNKMDEVDWSEDSFADSVLATNVVLRGLGVSEERILSVPVSGLHGDNLIELSSNLGWYSRTTHGGKQGVGEVFTVVAALDHIFS